MRSNKRYGMRSMVAKPVGSLLFSSCALPFLSIVRQRPLQQSEQIVCASHCADFTQFGIKSEADLRSRIVGQSGGVEKCV